MSQLSWNLHHPKQFLCEKNLLSIWLIFKIQAYFWNSEIECCLKYKSDLLVG